MTKIATTSLTGGGLCGAVRYERTAGINAMYNTPLGQPTNNWIAVASADHARRGRDACTDSGSGFMQVCHGKRAPLVRVQPGDRVAYYAPTVTMGGKDKLQSFVSIGIVQPVEPYAFDMGGGFVPYRRDVKYLEATQAPIAPLLDDFEFVEDRQRWGYKFRFGLFKINDHDMQLIANAMQAPLKLLQF
jgi:EVE domain